MTITIRCEHRELRRDTEGAPVWYCPEPRCSFEVAIPSAPEKAYREVLEETREVLADMGWHPDRGLRARVIEILRAHPTVSGGPP